MSLFYTNETNTLKNHKEKVGDIMTSLKNANRRVGSLFAVAALVLATITPGLVPAFASAAQLTERSVALSNSSAAMENVEYEIQFDTESAGSTGAVVLDFCENSPLIGSTCDAPAGFDASAATASGGFTVSQLDPTPADNTIVVAGTFASPTTIPLEGITNPDDAGTLYVRMVTYDTESNADGYTSTNLGTGNIDEGGAAVSITDTVGVSGAVLESMTFCVAGNVINQDNCTTSLDGGVLAPPTLKLGEDNGGVVALASNAFSTGSIYSQLSTNAAGGAVVSLKSGNDCGGLKRLTAADCDIVAANTANGNAVQGQPRLGVTVNPTGDTGGAFGTLAIAGGGSPFYSISDFKLNYTAGGASGVTSPFGDPILNTANGPASNKNATITFGASVNNQTPAGLYANDYSLIATGKY